ncbi:hypothetical protein EQW78_07690 [Oerskovia turbata]|uniref:Uncharacterized protein n=1 Tax=Oerskovia turbata TaxID=1713 RepID=A0A4Q1L084_9CELL|nr:MULTISPECIES: hypothetical protein [Oerskovia]QDW63518.1 hypothetical protein FFI11_014290 [Oerskovia sp. KBS0722]RXR24742.1 hypothetical protein EQW73_12890 [Oerskovia turbata]RXR35054.1 hypothetical protein EQW78_07690 [Oerskovia turbata]TGJ97121.1 hypothetical protein DLJ96_03625 [Actinotalea fermentans ATCC 43279 = JCM 9966 = DSM 3133]
MSSTSEHRTPDAVDLNESDVSSARISPRTRIRLEDEAEADVREGGDASKAPHSLSEAERQPSDGMSSGRSWDDPDEL